MRLEHTAIWTTDPERLRAFYERYFGARSGPRYESATQAGFSSYFLDFPEGGARLELMSGPALGPASAPPSVGYAHLAIALGSPDTVAALTTRMRGDGVPVLSEPRRTGDGYFEAVVADADGNRLELTA